MAEDKRDIQGNKPGEYQVSHPLLRQERDQARHWKARFKRAFVQLDMPKRLDKAETGDQYLEGTKTVKKSDKFVYYNYLLPLLEDGHRASLPDTPEPRVEARHERAEAFEDHAQQILSLVLGSDYSGALAALRELQWDDDRSGIGIVATEWEVDYTPATPAETTDPGQQAIEVERATAENADIARAQVAEADIDFIHIGVHRELLDQLEASGDPAYWQVQQHVEEHEARMLEVKRERVHLRRVPWYMFLYDTDVPWEKRGWEAEQRSERIIDLLNRGWKNINPENLTPEVRDFETDLAWEDCTAKVWHIHDRLTGRYLAMPADGPEDPLFLFQGPWPYKNVDTYQRLVLRPWKAERGYGMPTVQICLPLLDRLAHIDFHINRHVETHADYKLGGPAVADEDKIKAGLNNPNQRFVFAGPPEAWAMMKEMKPPPIPDSLLQQWDRAMGGLRHVVGADLQDTGAPMPHQISATESRNRGESRDTRADDKQRTMAHFLAGVAKNTLALYRQFGSQALMIRLTGEPGYYPLNPADIPEELEVLMDVLALTDAARAQKAQEADQYVQFLASTPLPVDWAKVNQWYAAQRGVRRPEQFILSTVQAPGNAEPGMENAAAGPGVGGGQGGGGNVIQFPPGGGGKSTGAPQEEARQQQIG